MKKKIETDGKWLDNFVFHNSDSQIRAKKDPLAKLNYSKNKILSTILSTLFGLIIILTPGLKNSANARNKDSTKISTAQYSQKTQVLEKDDLNTLKDTPKSFLVRKSQKAQTQEFKDKNNERLKKRRLESQLFNQVISELEKIEKENQIGKFVIKGVFINQKDEKLQRLKVLQKQNVENARKYANFIIETNKENKEIFEKKFFKFPTLPTINQTKQIEKQLKKEIVRKEIFKRNIIEFKNRQQKTDTLNKLLLLILPTFGTLYPIFFVNKKNEKKNERINVVKKCKITRENYVGITQFLQALEKRRNIEKLVENYEMIMLVSMFMVASELKFNSSGLIIRSSESFVSVETTLEKWITQNKILVCLIIFSTVTILTMKILSNLETLESFTTKKQEYFLYLLNVLKVLRDQEKFILQNISGILKDFRKEFILYLFLICIFNFLLFREFTTGLPQIPVTFEFEINLN